jgi:hypothetical protein
MPDDSSLPKLLDTHRGVRNQMDTPRLSLTRILRWADAHRRRTEGLAADRFRTPQRSPAGFK